MLYYLESGEHSMTEVPESVLPFFARHFSKLLCDMVRTQVTSTVAGEGGQHRLFVEAEVLVPYRCKASCAEELPKNSGEYSYGYKKQHDSFRIIPHRSRSAHKTPASGVRTFGKENTQRAMTRHREQADLLVVLHFTFLFSLDRAITPFRTQE